MEVGIRPDSTTRIIACMAYPTRQPDGVSLDIHVYRQIYRQTDMSHQPPPPSPLHSPHNRHKMQPQRRLLPNSPRLLAPHPIPLAFPLSTHLTPLAPQHPHAHPLSKHDIKPPQQARQHEAHLVVGEVAADTVARADAKRLQRAALVGEEGRRRVGGGGGEPAVGAEGVRGGEVEG
ncbi:hypothetical protein BC567DRAFT_66680 [Phyllosticta citribraziliensis]